MEVDDRELELDDEQEPCYRCGAPTYRDEGARCAGGYLCDDCVSQARRLRAERHRVRGTAA
jgi:hypothetical protein